MPDQVIQTYYCPNCDESYAEVKTVYIDSQNWVCLCKVCGEEVEKE